MTQLATHWEPDEALAMIQLLDLLKELLWSAYGDEIARQEYAEQKQCKRHEDKLALDFEDPAPFLQDQYYTDCQINRIDEALSKPHFFAWATASGVSKRQSDLPEWSLFSTL
jgi:hypothetical protein